jgi:hypothetical protein
MVSCGVQARSNTVLEPKRCYWSCSDQVLDPKSRLICKIVLHLKQIETNRTKTILREVKGNRWDISKPGNMSVNSLLD